jgi:anaerobic selenocysteine-containing dehydrogenase
MNNRSIAPLGEAIPNTELFRRLGQRMGFTESYFTRTDDEIIAAAFDWSAPQMAGITPASLRRDGWARLNLPSPDSYAPYAEGGFPTPSGKVEFSSSAAAMGNFVVGLFRQGSEEHQPGQPVDPLPTWIPPRESAFSPEAGNRLNLLSPKSHAYLNSSFADQPQQQRSQGEPVLLIHPEDAAARNIVAGSPVRISNERGSFVVNVKLSDDVTPGVVAAHMGAWRKHAKDLATVNAVTPFEFADLGNAPTFSDTWVDVAPA